MYEIDERWNGYYLETEPDRREKLYGEIISEAPEGYAFAKTLFELRHIDKKQPKNQVDKYLFACIVFISIERSGKMFSGSRKKEIRGFLEDMGCGLCDDELKKSLYYWEVRNAAKRYFKTCTSSGYRRKLFGIIKPSDNDRKYHILDDAWKMSVGLAEKFGMQEELAVWNSAIRDEYLTLEETSAEQFDSYMPGRSKKSK